MSSVMA